MYNTGQFGEERVKLSLQLLNEILLILYCANIEQKKVNVDILMC